MHPDKASAPGEIRTAYATLMTYLAQAMGATQVDAHMLLDTGRLPLNYDTRAVISTSRISGEDFSNPSSV